eukprot:3286382-Prymnesium_polylepis.1
MELVVRGLHAACAPRVAPGATTPLRAHWVAAGSVASSAVPPVAPSVAVGSASICSEVGGCSWQRSCSSTAMGTVVVVTAPEPADGRHRARSSERTDGVRAALRRRVPITLTEG